MYIPNCYAMDESQAWSLIKKWRFGLLLSQSPSGKAQSYLPFAWDDKNQKKMLMTHVAQLNVLSKLVENQSIEIFFQGPQAYISPAWYMRHPSVPTWNYVSIKVEGIVHLLTDSTAIFAQLMRGISQEDPLIISEMQNLPSSYVDKLIEQIVAINIEVKTLRGVAKISQDRSPEEREIIIAHLLASPSQSDQMLGSFMRDNPQFYTAK